MSRQQGETTQEWFARACALYVDAGEALEAERRRCVPNVQWVYPTFDEAYDAAMDALDDADNERGEATSELDREATLRFGPAPRIKWRNGVRFGTYPGN